MFSTGASIAMVFVALAAVIVFSTKFKLNSGILAIFAAWIVGCILNGLKVSTLVGYWPVTVMFILIATSLFFNVARENGTMEVLTYNLLYRFRKVTWAFPFVIFVINFIVGAGGAGSIAPQLLMSAVIWPLAASMGCSPIPLLVASWGGATAGGGFFWSAEGVNRLAYYTQYGEGVSADAVYLSVVQYSFVVLAALFFLTVVWFVVFRGWKVKVSADQIIKEPEPFNPVQKKTLILIGVVLLLILVPALLKLLVPSEITQFLAGVFDIQAVCILGFLVALAFGLCDEQKIISTVPMGLILTVCGLSMLISIAINFNLPELFAGILTGSGLPVWLLPTMFLIFSAIISLFSNFAVIYPLLMPLIPLVAAAADVNSMALFAGMCLGSCSTALSPFSMGGACQISACPPELVVKYTPRMLGIAACNAIILAAITSTGIFNLLPDPMALYPLV